MASSAQTPASARVPYLPVQGVREQAWIRCLQAHARDLNAPQTKTRPTSPQWQQIVNEVLVPMLQKSIGSNVNYAAVLAGGKANLEKILNQI